MRIRVLQQGFGVSWVDGYGVVVCELSVCLGGLQLRPPPYPYACAHL